ncbi:hypothetical protein HY642_05880 [Candidatus Woesearchaeota archaeon]|nr:hypothetical protein [Candidatus Woesearchaeota archaeon]
MPSKLYIIGTVHIDLHGPARLTKVLDALHPDVVGIELPESQRAMLAQFEALRNSNALDAFLAKVGKELGANPDTLRQLAMAVGFEYFAARDYCQRTGKPFHLCDNIGPNSVDIDFTQVVKEYASMPPDHAAKAIDALYDPPELNAEQMAKYQMDSRDAHVQTLLRTLEGRVAYVGGICHIASGYNNLCRRLEDLNPMPIMLPEADYLGCS